jgi:hypothetical protein
MHLDWDERGPGGDAQRATPAAAMQALAPGILAMLASRVV